MKPFIMTLFRLSILGSIMTGLVLIVRLLFQKHIRKVVFPILWIIVGLRLVIPFSLVAPVSPIPSEGFFLSRTTDSAEINGQTIVSDPSDSLPSAVSSDAAIDSPSQAVIDTTEPIAEVGESVPTKPAVLNSSISVYQILMWVWVLGTSAMLCFFLFSTVRILRKTKNAIQIRKGVFLSDTFNSAFIFGLLMPRIYLPSQLSDDEKACVTEHERTHIKRGDHITKILAYLILSLHWFNPIIWWAYFSLCQDIELACDERVTSKMTPAGKVKYAQTLLKLSEKKSLWGLSSVAFGKTRVKARLNSILQTGKPSVLLSIFIVTLSLLLSACLFTARPNNASSPLPGNSSEPSSTQDSESDSTKESANGTDQGTVKPWNPSRETILQGSLKDASKGLTLNIGTDYERGPNGIAAIGKDDILILDSAASRIQRYQNGQYNKTYPLPNGEEYLKMKLWEQHLFVLGRNSLCMLNLSSGQITSISLPKTDYGALCSAMVIHSGRLLLLSETAGNYELDPEYGTIKKSSLSYSMIRMESLGVETCCFNLPEGYWMIPAADKYMELLGTDENRSIILCATKKDTPKEMPGCCSILGFDHAGHALGEIALDLTETAFFTAGGDVCVGKDEGIYVLYVFVDHFTVQRIDTKKTK